MKRDPALEEQALQLTRRLQSQLSNFKNENKIFKGRFLFDQVDYYQWLPDLEEQLVSGEFYIKERMRIMEEQAKRKMDEERAKMEEERREREERDRIEREEREAREVERRR